MPEDSPEERIAFLREWSPEAAEAFRGVALDYDYELDFSPGSLEVVEAFLRSKLSGRRGRIKKEWHDLAGTTGAYVAEIILANLGGDWSWEPEWQRGGLLLPSGTFTSPLDKSRKRYEDGVGDDFVSYYEVLAESEQGSRGESR